MIAFVVLIDMTVPLILSYVQAHPLLRARSAGLSHALCSPDLGLSQVDATLTPGGVQFADGANTLVSWAQLTEIVDSEVNCFQIVAGAFKKVHAYSEAQRRHYSLMPTEAAPTMLVSGLPMHRIKDTNPVKDTRAKIKAAEPRGRVLDTATGLGYTAIEAAKSADAVVTVEIDPVAQEMCRANPWSQGLFDNPKIRQMIGDSFDVIQEFEPNSFSRVIHDPPMFSLAGDLYSGAFYEEVHRVLTANGRLFHYIGDPDSKSGSRVTRGVAERLKAAGFRKVWSAREAFGLVAQK